MEDLFNVGQRRIVTIALRRFEQHLRQADAWLQGGGQETGILYSRRLRLEPDLRAEARQVIASALEQLAELARQFDLTPVEEDLAAEIVGHMRIDWTDLKDVCSDGLKGCGAVDPRLAQELDPRLNRLATLAMTLMSRVRD